MATANEPQSEHLDSLLLTLLRDSGKELSTEELELKLADTVRPAASAFEVRAAIWRLIASKSAVFTAQRTIKAI